MHLSPVSTPTNHGPPFNSPTLSGKMSPRYVPLLHKIFCVKYLPVSSSNSETGIGHMKHATQTTDAMFLELDFMSAERLTSLRV